jgi:tetratricopeptide (TPR) repeat protein
MKRTVLLFCTFTVLIFCVSRAQTTKVDSLENLLTQARADTSQVKILCELAQIYWSTEPDKTLTYALKAQDLATSLGYTSGLARSYQLQGIYFWQKGDYPAALKAYTQASDWYASINDPFGVAKALSNIAMIYKEQSDFSAALENYMQALKVIRESGDRNVLASVNNSIGVAYRESGNYAESLNFFQEARKLYESLGDRKSVAGVTSNIGNVYKDQQQYPAAIEHNATALAAFTELKDVNGQIICHNNLGELYLLQGDLPQSLAHYQLAMQLNEKFSSKKLLVSSYNGMGGVYSRLSQYPQAIDFYHKAQDLAQATGIKTAVQDAYRGLMNVYVQAKDYENAYRYQQLYMAVKDSVFNAGNAARIATIQARFENERKQVEIELLQKERALATTTRNALIGGLFGSLLIAALGLNWQRSRSRKNKELLEKNHQIALAQQALMEAELKTSQIKEQQLQQELEYRSKELTTHTLNLIQKNGIMEEIRETISEALKAPNKPENSPVYSRLIRLIDYSFSLDKDWDEFKIYFEQVHKEFFVKLKEYCPDLSGTELRLCALVRLNMNLKESATVLGISPESVKTARHRLRKKLNLPEETTLNDFIMGI